MPKCTINGKEVEVKAGATIIEAFKMLSEDIAHYCWHPGLSIAGVCRLCMVKIEGNPRLQIACNTVVQDGMVISNQDQDVIETVQWGMEFHLINHPLDCPICDQAGECGLQDQYMKFGKYDSEMAERKVKKRKVVDLGEKVVLDSERCILCSRCVRFTKEVTKTNELGIFNRGDHSEIGVFEDKPLNNNYSVNTIDICPVGALTSKDFRFKQRVWYLKNSETICNGCSTGCNVKVYYNEEGIFRVKPVHNENVNGHWMCDEGRDLYKFVNRKSRLTRGSVRVNGSTETMDAGMAAQSFGEFIKGEDAEKIAVILTGQYSNEEYKKVMDDLVGSKGIKNIYHWVNNKAQFEDFDKLLLRGDRNPNTKGLIEALESKGITLSWADLASKLDNGTVKTVIVAGPENPVHFPEIDEVMTLISKATTVAWLGAPQLEEFNRITSKSLYLIPMKSYLEKSGTYINHKGIAQKVEAVSTLVRGALSLSDACDLFMGRNLDFSTHPALEKYVKKNFLSSERGQL